MFCSIILAGGTGLLLGLRFRVPAVFVASVVVAVACIATAPLIDLPLLTSVAVAFGLLSALQGGYLMGLIVRGAWSRFLSSPDKPSSGRRGRGTCF